MADEIAPLSAELKEADQPQTPFKAIDRATKALVGHRRVTILLVDDDHVERLYRIGRMKSRLGDRSQSDPPHGADSSLKGESRFLAQTGRRSDGHFQITTVSRQKGWVQL